MTDTAIFTMEKVGSSTVMRAIKSAGLDAHKIYPGNMHSFDLGDFTKIITVVRDPIARNLSAMFEFDRTTEYDTAPLTWFDNAILPLLGIDVFDRKFDRKKGWAIYDERLLVIRTESITDQLSLALAAFFGVDHEKFTVEHRGRGKEKFGAKYDKYVSQAKFDGETLDLYYDTKYAKHFYYVKEIKEFRKRWLK